MPDYEDKKMIIHVHPENDIRKHRLTKTMKCWCSPTITEYETGYRVSHNSADEREFVENNLNELLDENKSWEVTEI
jgi:hypothetical protein